MKKAYLPIRSFGDFIITVSLIKNSFSTKVPVILPPYLVEIFEAINGDQYFKIIDTIDYDDQPAFFEFYKVRDLKNALRLLKDVMVMASFVKNQQQYLLDYRSRRLFFARGNFIWPPAEENIYEGKFKLLQQQGFITSGALPTEIIQSVNSGSHLRILILPDSRISTKSINLEVIDLLMEKLESFHIRTAHFLTRGILTNGCLQYASFSELIRLINTYDWIISAESLPYHLANYLNKPHLVVYNQSRHFKSTFMTPFMLKNNYYTIFTGDNSEQVVEDICNKILG